MVLRKPFPLVMWSSYMPDYYSRFSTALWIYCSGSWRHNTQLQPDMSVVDTVLLLVEFVVNTDVLLMGAVLARLLSGSFAVTVLLSAIFGWLPNRTWKPNLRESHTFLTSLGRFLS